MQINLHRIERAYVLRSSALLLNLMSKRLKNHSFLKN
jgi:hypothetical protein